MLVLVIKVILLLELISNEPLDTKEVLTIVSVTDVLISMVRKSQYCSILRLKQEKTSCSIFDCLFALNYFEFLLIEKDK